jgi:hypothetical protein
MFTLMTGLAWFMSSTSFAGEVVDASAAATDTKTELKIGYRVKNRELVPLAGDGPLIAGETVIAWTKVTGLGAGFMQHVWYHNGLEVVRHDLPVGAGRSWRSWSRHRVSAGHYEVKVLAPDGRELASDSFDVVAEGSDTEH